MRLQRNLDSWFRAAVLVALLIGFRSLGHKVVITGGAHEAISQVRDRGDLRKMGDVNYLTRTFVASVTYARHY
jgi:hypothetical protein